MTFFFDEGSKCNGDQRGDQYVMIQALVLGYFGLDLIQNSFAGDEVAGHDKDALAVDGFEALLVFEDFVDSILSGILIFMF